MTNRKFRERSVKKDNTLFLGKNAKNNDELMEKYKGKENIILHTIQPGSPFCVINELNPSKKTIVNSGAVCAGYSQDWRDNKKDVLVHQFTGKEIKKPFLAKIGTWKIKGKPKTIKIKKKDIEKWIKEKENK